MTAATASPAAAALDPEAFFRALADRTRLRCLSLLAREGELCVCELVHALDLAQPKVSRHLRLLREAGVVSDRRTGLWIHYRLAPDLPDWAATTLTVALDAHRERPPFAGDAARLAAMADRPVRCG